MLEEPRGSSDRSRRLAQIIGDDDDDAQADGDDDDDFVDSEPDDGDDDVWGDDTLDPADDDDGSSLPVEDSQPAASTTDATALGADSATASCDDCGSTLEPTNGTAEISDVTTTPDYTQGTVALNGGDGPSQLGVAVTKDGTIYGCYPNDDDDIPPFTGSTDGTWSVVGSDDGSNVFPASGTELDTSTYAQDNAARTIDLAGVGGGPAYNLNLSNLTATPGYTTGTGYTTTTVGTTDAWGQPLRLPYR